MMSEYSEIDLDQDPCIIPACGHLLTVSSMDGHMDMQQHYEMEEHACVKIKDSVKSFSMDEVKKCPKCRASLRNICRYGRIVRRALIDQSSKRFIMWAREQYLCLFQQFHDRQRHLQDTNETARIQHGRQEKLELKGTRESHLRLICQALHKRYDMMRELRSRLAKHVDKVAIEEQPFKRIWDLVQHVRRRQECEMDIPWSSDAVQVGESLRAQSLLFRCDLAIIADFLSVAEAHLDATVAKANSLDLIAAAKDAHLPLQETEGHIFFARYCAMERKSASTKQINQLVTDGKFHVEEAKHLCQQHPGSTRPVINELEEVEEMLNKSTFYAQMKDDEWKEIMTAMRREYIGTGHWYTCQNGHPFAIGECGRPMEETICPECGAPVGGRSHNPAVGVREAEDLVRRFGGMRV